MATMRRVNYPSRPVLYFHSLHFLESQLSIRMNAPREYSRTPANGASFRLPTFQLTRQLLEPVNQAFEVRLGVTLGYVLLRHRLIACDLRC